jgi:hypothetical protein
MATQFEVFDPSRFTGIEAVLITLDCHLRRDVGWDGDTAQAIYALGNAKDDGNPIDSHLASPWFTSLTELDVFCVQHLDDYTVVAHQVDHSGVLPERWFWEIRL